MRDFFYNPDESEGLPGRLGALCDQVIVGLIVLAIVCVPFFVFFDTVQGTAFERQMLLAVFVVAMVFFWGLKSIILGDITFRRSPLDIPFLVFVFVVVLSTIFSHNIWQSILGPFGAPHVGAIGLISFIVFYLFVFTLLTPQRLYFFIAALLIPFVLSSGLLLLAQVLPIVGQGTFVAEVLPQLPAQFVALAGILLPLFGAVVVLFAQQAFFDLVLWRQRLLWSGAGIMVLAIVGAMIQTQQWVVSAMLLWGLLAFGVFLFVRQMYVGHPTLDQWRSRLQHALTTPRQVLLVSVALVLLMSASGAVVWLGQRDASDWAITRQALAADPLLGAGPGFYGPLQSLYSDGATEFLRQDQAQGSLLEALSTMGLTGTLAVLFVAIIGTVLLLFFLLRGSREKSILSGGLVMTAVTFLLAQLFIAFDTAVLMVGYGVLAMAAYVVFAESNVQAFHIRLSHGLLLQRVMMGIFLLFVLLGGGFLVQVFRADLAAGHALAAAEMSSDTSARLLQAQQTNPRQPYYHVFRAQVLASLLQDDALDAERAASVRATITQELTTAARRAPQDPFVHEAAAGVYTLLGNRAAALAAYDRVQALAPTNTTFATTKGQFLVEEALAQEATDAEEADALFTQADTLFADILAQDPAAAQASYYRGIIAERREHLDAAVDFFQVAYDQTEQTNTTYAIALANVLATRAQGDDLARAEALFTATLGTAADQELRTLFRLGVLYEQQGRTQEALDAYTQALALLPPDAITARERITQVIENLENGHSNVGEIGE